MSDTLERLSIESLPASRQNDAWRDGLAALFLDVRTTDRAAKLYGDITLKISPTDARWARVRSGAQVLGHRRDAGAEAMLILFHADGRGRVANGSGGSEFAEGDISVCAMRESWTLDLREDFEFLLLEIPHQRLSDRLGRGAVKLPTVLGASIAAAAVRPVLHCLAANFDELTDADLPSVEIAIIELIASALIAEAKPVADGSTQVQSAHMRRVFAAIEAQLGEPRLSMGDIADKEQLSPRYLQRLFERQGLTFSGYVKRRRLERCRQDLIDPKYAGQSIAEIGFRWGFRDQARFSRTFSQAFGTPPRNHRKAHPAKSDVYPYRGRPPARPAALHAAPPLPASIICAETPSHMPVNVTRCDESEKEPHFHLPISKDTVHWGYLSRMIPPALFVPPQAIVTVETLTHHAFDDYERMIKGDAGAESVMQWTKQRKAIERRGAGPMNASIVGRGAGEGFGVHICTGPIHVRGAEPGDVLAIEILAIEPRPSANPAYAGRVFGSNAAAWWGYQYDDLIDAPKRREVVTIFEVDGSRARAVHSYRWTPQTDPFGVRHEIMDYPGVPVDHASIEKRHGTLAGISVPLRPHFGFMAVAPKEADIVDSVPPGYFGGNIDNWRAGVATTFYLPVAVPGALLSIGDPHLTQGDGEINGTALEGSLTGTFRLTLHKKGDRTNRSFLKGLAAPLLETPDAFVLHGFSYGNYLRELGRNAQTEIYRKSSVDRALRNAFRATRKFLMEHYGLSEDEALALMSLGVDFGITQVADGNWGVHAIIRKEMFAGK